MPHDRLRVPAILACLTALIITTLTSSAFASTIRVEIDGSGDHATIEAAVAVAGSGDVIEVGPGNYAIPPESPSGIWIEESLDIVSTDGPGDTFIDGLDERRHFLFDAGSVCSLRGFTLRRGYADGAGGSVSVVNGSQLQIDHCRFLGNTASSQGGGIHVRHDNSVLIAENCLFDGNRAVAIGGGAGTCILGGVLEVRDSSIINNTAGYAFGGLAVNAAELIVERCFFQNNSGLGGGAVNYSKAWGAVRDCTFYGNLSEHGSVRVESTSYPVVIQRNIFAFDRTAAGLSLLGSPTTHECNLYWGNAQGPILDTGLGPDELQLDPLFCDIEAGDFSLRSDSPASAEHSLCGELIGGFGVGCSPSQNEALQFSIDDGNGVENSIVSVALRARRLLASKADAGSLAGIDLTLQWDPTVADLIDVLPTSATGDWQLAVNSSSGEVRISMARAIGLDVGTDGVEMLGFRFLLRTNDGVSPLHLAELEAFDSMLQSIEVELVDGSLTAGCTKGDVFFDGDINSADAVLTLKIAAQLHSPTIQEWCAADMNDDSQVNSGDAVLILRKAVGLDKTAVIPVVGTAPSLNLEQAGNELLLRLTGAVGLDAVLRYDPAELRFLEARSEAGVVVVNDERRGELRLVCATAATDEATIALRMEAMDGGGTITLDDAVAFDTSGDRLELGTFDTSIFFAAAQIRPGAKRFVGLYPNPLNPRTEIRLRLDGGAAELSIYDAAGRRIRGFDLSALGAGEHSVPWNGEDDAGRAVASGIYHVRLLTSAGTEIKQAVLLK